MTIWNVFELMGGLALFIFGMNLLSDGLKVAAGSYLKKILESLTHNRWIAMLVGAGLTAMIQSSNAICVMVVGFVNAGMMQLERSVGILMGAKIGTTITGQLIAFNITQIAPLIAFIGVAVLSFSKKPKVKVVGQVIASLGVLFIGLGMMSSTMEPLRNATWFRQVLSQLSNPILGVLVGVIFTVIIQSASASIGVLQIMVLGGVIGFENAFFVMVGMNIGASVAPALASIGATKDAKRVAFIVFLFEFLGMLLFLLTYKFIPFLTWMEASSANPSRQIANANTIFNIVTVACCLPLSSYLVRIAKFVIPGEDQKEERALHYIDSTGYQTGTVLLEQIDMEVGRMQNLVRANIVAANRMFFEKDLYDKEKFDENESTVDFLNNEITKSLIRLGEMDINEDQASHVGNLYHIVTDLERIGDHAENIAGYAEILHENKLEFSNKASKDLKVLTDKTVEIYDMACVHFNNPSANTYRSIYDLEEKIDRIVDKMRNSNIKRLSKMKCGATQGLYLSETLVDLERMADHSLNIAKATKRYDLKSDTLDEDVI